MRAYIIFAFVTLAFVEVTRCCDNIINVDCSSINYQYKTCQFIEKAGAYNEIKLIRQYSKSTCTLGKTFDVKNNYVWVNKGCRGKFNVCTCTNYRVVDCDSHSYKHKECNVSNAKKVTYVTVASKKSKSDCTYGSSYGITGNKMWVDHGCRARFHVCYDL